jgi:hypothetical protein
MCGILPARSLYAITKWGLGTGETFPITYVGKDPTTAWTSIQKVLSRFWRRVHNEDLRNPRLRRHWRHSQRSKVNPGESAKTVNAVRSLHFLTLFSVRHQTSTTETTNAETEWLAFLIRIREGPGFNSRHEERLSCLRVFEVFLGPSRFWTFEIGHNLFLPYPFQFIIHRTIPRYTA